MIKKVIINISGKNRAHPAAKIVATPMSWEVLYTWLSYSWHCWASNLLSNQTPWWPD